MDNSRKMDIGTNNGVANQGDNVVINNQVNVGELREITDKLVTELQKTDLQEQVRNEIADEIKETTKAIENGNKPSRFSFNNLLAGINAAIATVKTTPDLIQTINKWKEAIQIWIS